jgi:hypothetical protein
MQAELTRLNCAEFTSEGVIKASENGRKWQKNGPNLSKIGAKVPLLKPAGRFLLKGEAATSWYGNSGFGATQILLGRPWGWNSVQNASLQSDEFERCEMSSG